MPKGKYVGLPRPLAVGDITILVTTENSSFPTYQYERTLNTQGSIQDRVGSVSVELDESVDTYAINTGVDVMSVKDINKIKSVAKNQYLPLDEGDRVVEPISVGFQ